MQEKSASSMLVYIIVAIIILLSSCGSTYNCPAYGKKGTHIHLNEAKALQCKYDKCWIL